MGKKKKKPPKIMGSPERMFKSDCCGGNLKWDLCDELASYTWRCKTCKQMCLPIRKTLADFDKGKK